MRDKRCRVSTLLMQHNLMVSTLKVHCGKHCCFTHFVNISKCGRGKLSTTTALLGSCKSTQSLISYLFFWWPLSERPTQLHPQAQLHPSLDTSSSIENGNRLSFWWLNLRPQFKKKLKSCFWSLQLHVRQNVHMESVVHSRLQEQGRLAQAQGHPCHQCDPVWETPAKVTI